MLKTKKFSSAEDVYVSISFENYQVGDIISGGTLEKTKAVKLWLRGFIQNVGTPRYTKEQLESMNFKTLRKIGEPLGVVDRSKAGLVREILLSV